MLGSVSGTLGNAVTFCGVVALASVPMPRRPCSPHPHVKTAPLPATCKPPNVTTALLASRHHPVHVAVRTACCRAMQATSRHSADTLWLKGGYKSGSSCFIGVKALQTKLAARVATRREHVTG